jgi:hypothetical protein
VSKFGDSVDCIDFAAQPAVRDILAKGFPLPADTPPSGLIASNQSSLSPPAHSDAALDGTPDSNGSSRSCPTGTVPFTRPSVAQIQQAGGLSAYLSPQRAAKRSRPPTGEPDCSPVHSNPGADYDHACGYLPVALQGTYAVTSIYTPYLENSGDHTLSQTWTMTGTCASDYTLSTPYICSPGTGVQTVEAGWIVGPPNSDYNTHLFVYSTQDGYNNTSCWAGFSSDSYYCVPTQWFVEYSGAAYYPQMTLQTQNAWSNPAELSIQVYNGGGNAGYPKQWNVIVNDNYIGYYPGYAFTGQMQTSASLFQVGGEVLDSWGNDGQHTSTVMGSGYYPGAGYGLAAYSRNIQWMSPYPTWAWSNASLDYMNGGSGICGWEASWYYGLSTTTAPGASGWGTYFYFGGDYTY